VTAAALEIFTESAEETMRAGAILAGWLRDGDVVLLHGDLGAGKTTLAKGIASALRVDDVVASPSFALVNEYDAGLAAPIDRLYHLDLYRLLSGDELDTIGFDDYVNPVDGVTVVEWPERASGRLPDRYLLIELESNGGNRRRLRVTPVPNEAAWLNRIDDLRALLSAAEGSHASEA
jgi:tRNA threonylcarbamoyl adenosine modification protein YjeE